MDGGKNPGTLEDEGTYYYRVRAVNAVTAESQDSETVSALTRAVPPEVKHIVAVSDRPREVPLSWDLPKDESVIGYEIWRATGDEDDWVQVVRLNSREVLSYLDRGGRKNRTELGLLKDGTVYQYKLIAFNTGNVRSSASAPVQAKTKVIPVPPTELQATEKQYAFVTLPAIQHLLKLEDIVINRKITDSDTGSFFLNPKLINLKSHSTFTAIGLSTDQKTICCFYNTISSVGSYTPICFRPINIMTAV